MSKPRIIILGGGISGLTLAYDLGKHSDRFEVHLIEKSDRLGGWVDTDTSTGFFFEKGARIFQGSRSPHFLTLIRELGLEPEMIESPREGHRRFIWMEGRLRRIPILSWGLIQGLYRDWRAPPLKEGDESVWEFALRRFNQEVAQQFFDPLVTGIYGGDMRELSARSCLPFFKNLEEVYGSVVKGLFKAPRSSDSYRGPSRFGFQRGMKSVVQRLHEKASAWVHLEEEVSAICPKEEAFEVKTSKGLYQADYLFSALPAQVVGKLFIPQLLQLPFQGTTVVNLGYRKNLLRKKGFGYLVSSKEKSDVLGVVFDSNAFPQCNRCPEETRLSVMLKDPALSDGEARSIALQTVAKQLGVVAKPEVSMVIHAPSVFPQFRVGHQEWMHRLEQELKIKYPRFFLAGNYLYGVGVNDCIARARSVAKAFLEGA